MRKRRAAEIAVRLFYEVGRRDVLVVTPDEPFDFVGLAGGDSLAHAGDGRIEDCGLGLVWLRRHSRILASRLSMQYELPREMARYVELRRHTDADGDVLTEEGVRDGLRIGATLEGNYELLVSTGAQRATQTLACFLAALGERVPGGVVVEPGLRSTREDHWREAYRKAGSGELEAMRTADPELVEEDSAALGAALRRVFDALSEGGRALVVGHSPTNEAAVLGLTGQIVDPLAKGAGVLVVADDGFRVTSRTG